MKTAAQIALFLAIFVPSIASAQTFVTPNGTVVNELGQILSTPEKDILAPYKANPSKYTISVDYKGCTIVRAHPPKTMAGPIVYTKCK